VENGQCFVEIADRTKTVHQGGHVVSGRGFGKRLERFRTVDPVRSWSLVPEEFGPWISQRERFQHFLNRGFKR
jgi:hypothetical protein